MLKVILLRALQRHVVSSKHLREATSYNSCRLLCHSPPAPQDHQKEETKVAPAEAKPLQQNVSQKTEIGTKVRRYGLSRYLHYVQAFERTLETNFPSAMHVYRVFIVGIKEFYKDLKHFLRVARLANSQGFKILPRRDIELYYQMPRDMLRVAPVLLISALPFANYVVFPLAYMYPRQLLCSHFWSIQQRVDFAVYDLRKRLYNQRPVLRCMQGRLEDVDDPEMFHKWRHILGLLGSGVHPTTEQILEVKQLFAKELHLNSLYSNHVNGLLRLHSMHIGWRRRSRLKDRAFILHEMDMAMLREGVTSMTLDEMRWACFLRGLNPTTMKTEDMSHWLEQWTQISSAINTENVSLLLHAPILLSYNEPSNWVLIY